jgi:hypothetical protein
MISLLILDPESYHAGSRMPWLILWSLTHAAKCPSPAMCTTTRFTSSWAAPTEKEPRNMSLAAHEGQFCVCGTKCHR